MNCRLLPPSSPSSSPTSISTGTSTTKSMHCWHPACRRGLPLVNAVSVCAGLGDHALEEPEGVRDCWCAVQSRTRVLPTTEVCKTLPMVPHAWGFHLSSRGPKPKPRPTREAWGGEITRMGPSILLLWWWLLLYGLCVLTTPICFQAARSMESDIIAHSGATVLSMSTRG